MTSLISLLERKSLGTKLFWAVGYGLVIMLLIDLNTISNIRTLSDETNIIYESYFQCVSHLKEANIHLVHIRENIAQLSQTDIERNNQSKSNITKATLELQEEMVLARTHLVVDEDKKLLADFDTFLTNYLSNINQAISLGHFGNERKQSDNTFNQFIVDADFVATANTTEELLSTLSRKKESQALIIAEDVKKMRAESEHVSLLMMIIGMLITAISGFLIAKSITGPVSRLQTAIEDLAAGNLDVVIPHVNDKNEIGAIAKSAAVLQTMCRGMETQRWIKDNFATISTELYQVENLSDFAQKFLSAVCPLINAVYGAFYVYTQDELYLLNTYGENKQSPHKLRIALGEGLVGQCAVEKKLIDVTDVPEDYIKINSGLGESIPKHIVIYPILRVNTLIGVLEIAFFKPFTKTEKLLLSALMPMVALCLDILDRNLKTQELLKQTIEQADHMEMQAAQLEEQAVELELQQAELKETEAWFRGIIESAPDAMLVVDGDGTIVLCNKQADEVFGYPPGELIWKNVDNLVPVTVRAQHPAMRQQFMEEGGIRMMGAKKDLLGMRKDGSHFPIEVGLSKLPNTNGQSFICVSARDVTIKKEADIALYHAKKIAEDTTQMKSDFLANMSHEIRTPMNAIVGISHLIMKTELSNKQLNYMRKIQSSSQHLLGIINDILDLSKVEAGKIAIEQIDFKIEKTLNNLVNLISSKVKDKGLSLVFDIDENLPVYINGDPLRLGQVLINYANNAVKFTEEGEIVITVKVLEDKQNELLLYFGVRDTGIGLNDETKTKLFQSFQQADSSISRKYGGSGLGLSISKQLVELMNGEVGVESELGKGSLFWFTARLKKANKKMPYLTQAKNLKGRRVLVVDDTELARYILETGLSNIGLNVTQASSGKQAIKNIKQAEKEGEPYEIVFLDWYMPDMDGAETAKAIRNLALSHMPHITIITAHGREEVLSEMHNMELDNILIKPVNASLLFDLVIRLLSETHESPKEIDDNLTDHPGFSYIVEDLKIIQGASILVVEDNELNQEVALGLLLDEGFEVDIANDGREAIKMINHNHYDIVLMDMQMPVMNGVDATIEIRKNPKFNTLPIVAMTANAMLQDREKCKQAGMIDFISKPIDPEELFRTLLRWVRPTLTDALQESDIKKIQSNYQEIESLPKIDGLDIALGLKRVMGKTSLYLNLLRHYASNQEFLPELIYAALEENDLETAERLAHTAKNVSGNIGASELEKLAGEIEHLLRTNMPRDVIDVKLDHFEKKQQPFIAQIRTAVSTLNTSDQETSVNDIEDIDAETTAQFIQQLSDFLLDDDSAALTYLEDNSAIIRRSFSAEVFSKIEIAIKQFNFEKALHLLTSQSDTSADNV